MLEAIFESLPRSGKPRTPAKEWVDSMFSYADRVELTPEIDDISSIGYGMIENATVFYFEVRFRKFLKPHSMDLECEIGFDINAGGNLRIFFQFRSNGDSLRDDPPRGTIEL
ncbi:MAG: hypothetical protein HY059_11880 [Proteobacteria bacterium]|nr:hypothetical protein [Pseudomonadota bacterium]